MDKIKTLLVRDWDGNPSLVTRTLENGYDFIVNNEAIPTRKLDGTSCMVKDGKLYKRHDRKRRGKKGAMLDEWKEAPEGWIPCEMDERTGHWWGWAIVDFSKPENWMHKEAWINAINAKFSPSKDGFGNAIEGGIVEIDEFDKIAAIDVNAIHEILEQGKATVSKVAYHERMKITSPLPDGTYELCGPSIVNNPEHVDKHVLIPHGKDALDFKFNGGDPYDELVAWLKDKDIEGIVWWNDGEPVAKIKKRDFGLPRVPGQVVVSKKRDLGETGS